ncbi:AlpA family phage regulatory protein [Lysobacter sp. HDW10]|uniref:helix-turn-helix transcriptional regulator n=1 Tax=Lysobacter sp. HDW10 TaxID=2714936 RepID=UPI00140B37C0|nr:AlpA family phage regulatory protein [Lysobacter sp. HDW10]QIK80566.1 AlpA family phage regulatory protein [Lysobacter sp. HDW10]
MKLESTRHEAIWRMKPLCSHLGVSVSQGYWLRKNDPAFPKPVRLGRAAVGFLPSDIDAWLESKKEVSGH